MTDAKEYYSAQFHELEKQSSDAPMWLRNFRRKAFEIFLRIPFPTTHDEEWRFTNVAPVLKSHFPSSFLTIRSAQDFSRVQHSFEQEQNRLVFVDGKYIEALSIRSDTALRVENFQRSILLGEKLPRQLAENPSFANAFTALNAAFLNDGAVIEIPADTVLEHPLHVLFVSTTEVAVHPRIYLRAGERSQATVIESYFSAANIRYFTNAVTEVTVNEGAVLHHLKVQAESPRGFHIATIQVDQDRDSKYSSFLLTLGAELSRNDLNVRLNGIGAECTLNGLYLVSGNQHADHQTSIDHVRPHGTSQELYKGILTGEARAVFNGKIIVRKDAQGTDARQTNKNLLLSEGTRINTKPQLEILADDVKCNHGATIGHLEEEALFYLRSRGISDRDARILLMYGFVNDVTSRIQLDSVRKRVEADVMERLKRFSLEGEAA